VGKKEDRQQIGEEGSKAMDARVAFKIENEEDNKRKLRSKNGKSQTNKSAQKGSQTEVDGKHT
jgi:hypothetical protein